MCCLTLSTLTLSLSRWWRLLLLRDRNPSLLLAPRPPRPLSHKVRVHVLARGHGVDEAPLLAPARVAAGEEMDAYLQREGPGRPRREKKRWVPVAKKKKPPPAAEGKS